MSVSLTGFPCWQYNPPPIYDDAEKALRFADCVGDLAAGRKRMLARDGCGTAIDVTDYVIALVRANRGWHDPGAARESRFLGAGWQEARRIGRAVFTAFGLDGMEAVRDCIAFLLPLGAANDLATAWQGIGEWPA